ncbi:MAG: hypothetical protein KGI50_03700 [Patescibacteria group bacterium]|nr:hypothetical protein [Patescibacteria group bacterium]MDE2438395.1 hypothetical protein [Patescibacteria group bacterium]
MSEQSSSGFVKIVLNFSSGVANLLKELVKVAKKDESYVICLAINFLHFILTKMREGYVLQLKRGDEVITLPPDTLPSQTAQ